MRRYRRRYLALMLEGSVPGGGRELEQAILNAIIELFGEDKAADARLKLIEYDASAGLAIIRCAHKCLTPVRAAIASITELDGRPLAIHVLDVSGTLRALRKRLPSRAKGLSKAIASAERG